MKISLSFDNGPDATVTGPLLDLLDRKAVKATFFVLGRQLEDPTLRDLTVAAFQHGHRIGNHTWSHSVPLGELPAMESVSELERTETAIGELIGEDPLFRPFGRRGAIGPHLLNAASWNFLRQRAYTGVLWNSLAREWDRPKTWPRETAAECAQMPWAVPVIHDIRDQPLHHFEEFIDRMKDAGAEFRQDFPNDVLLLLRGEPLLDPRDFVSDPELIPS